MSKYIPVVQRSDYLRHPYAVLDPVTKKFAPLTPMPVSKECLFCEETFFRKPRQIATHWRKQKFCDAVCQAKNITTKVTINCETCKASILRQPYQLHLSKWHFCDMSCRNKHPHYQNLSRLLEGISRDHLQGERNWNWKGGITPLYKRIRALPIYKAWVLDVFTRDNFTCLDCGDNRGGNLEAHHLISFSHLLEQNVIKTSEGAEECSMLWDIENGVTLCKKCHKKTPNWGSLAKYNPIDRRIYI